MDKVKTFYNFEKIYERGQKKFKKIIAHNLDISEHLSRITIHIKNYTNKFDSF